MRADLQSALTDRAQGVRRERSAGWIVQIGQDDQLRRGRGRARDFIRIDRITVRFVALEALDPDAEIIRQIEEQAISRLLD